MIVYDSLLQYIIVRSWCHESFLAQDGRRMAGGFGPIKTELKDCLVPGLRSNPGEKRIDLHFIMVALRNRPNKKH